MEPFVQIGIKFIRKELRLKSDIVSIITHAVPVK